MSSRKFQNDKFNLTFGRRLRNAVHVVFVRVPESQHLSKLNSLEGKNIEAIIILKKIDFS